MTDSTNQLILMRHAKSDWDSGATSDFLRPLSDRGIRDARLMGRWLKGAGYRPRSVLCSTAVRARQTVELVASTMAVGLESLVSLESALYLSSESTIRAVLRNHARHSDVMLVGHNPGLEDLLRWLVRPAELDGNFAKLFPTAGVYVLGSEPGVDELSRGCARLLAHQRPKFLR